MVVLSAVLVPVCILAGWRELGDARAAHFFALILVLETFMIGVFAARDVFLFYVFFEAMLIPVYFLIGQFGGAQRRYAAVKFLLYSLFGGLVMLIAVIGVYFQGKGGPQGFLTSNLTGISYSSSLVERLLFLGFFLAFAIKAPMWPVHTWLPDAAAEAPAGVAVLLVGVLDKVGTFGMLTLCLPLFPGASKWAAPVVLALAVVSVVYGGLLAIGQSDVKRLIAFTSVSHFGFIVLGIFAFTTTGQAGSALYMINHGFSTAALFLVAGMLIARRGSQQIDDYGGLQRSTPLLAGAFLVAGLSSLALPGLSSFISEFLVLVGTFTRYPAAAVVATLGMVLASLYILLTYQRMFTGPAREFAAGLARHERPRGLGGGPADRRDRRARLLPQAGARRPQPRDRPHDAPDVVDRPDPDRAGRAPGAAGRRRDHEVSALALLPSAVTFTSPSLDYGLTSPMLIVFAAALVGVLAEAFVPRRLRFVDAGRRHRRGPRRRARGRGDPGRTRPARDHRRRRHGHRLRRRRRPRALPAGDDPRPRDRRCAHAWPTGPSTPAARSHRRPPPSPARPPRPRPGAPAWCSPRCSRCCCSPSAGCCSSRRRTTC